MEINYNELMFLKKEMEELYTNFEKSHNDILKLIEISECIDNEKIDEYYSYLKEYESALDLLKSNFLLLSSNHKKLESCLSPTKLLKKKRLTKIKSKMLKRKNDKNDENEDDFEDDDCFDLEV